MTARFGPAVVEALDRADELTIETARRDGSRRRTIIWVVVDGPDVFVRSVRGEDGRWYRDLIAEPMVSLLAPGLPGGALPARAVPAADDESVERCSRALRAKYPPGSDLDSMLQPSILPTTLRLEPPPR